MGGAIATIEREKLLFAGFRVAGARVLARACQCKTVATVDDGSIKRISATTLQRQDRARLTHWRPAAKRRAAR